MSIVSGFKKVKNYIKETDGYKLLSRWTSSDTVDVNGKTLTEAINGLNTSINGKANSVHTHGNGDITSLDASKITSGTIDIDRLPQGALERLTVVSDDTARFKLTSSNVQKGDTVKVTSTGKMYYVVDEAKLSTEAGYEVYAAGTAVSVPWSGVTGKPSTYTPSSHTHTKSQITDFPTSMPANGGNSSTVNGHTVKSDVPENAVFTDTVYDDTEVKESITELNSNLDGLGYGEVAGGKNILDITQNYKRHSDGILSVSGNKITVTGKWYCYYIIDVEENTDYFISFNIDSSTKNADCAVYNEEVSTPIMPNCINKSFNSGNNTRVAVLFYSGTYESGTTVYSNIQIEEGTQATPYEPYIPSVKMLAEEKADK